MKNLKRIENITMELQKINEDAIISVINGKLPNFRKLNAQVIQLSNEADLRILLAAQLIPRN